MAEKYILTDELKKYFGFDTFKGNQEAIIQNLLDGNDTFVLMPTGGGKSLCYQLPSLLMEGTAIVISPLIALMKNQVDAMRNYSEEDGIAHFINSSLNRNAIDQVKDDILSGKTKLLYVAPESLTKEENVEFLKSVKISFYAIDEAHCISEWGHDFRPEYRKIRPIVNQVGKAPLIALTATATPKVQHDIQKNLGMMHAKVFKSSFNRPNLYYEVRTKTDDVDKDIIKYIKSNPDKSGIIYCLSRKKVEELSEILVANGIKAKPYHAGMDSVTRTITSLSQIINPLTHGSNVVISTAGMADPTKTHYDNSGTFSWTPQFATVWNFTQTRCDADGNELSETAESALFVAKGALLAADEVYCVHAFHEILDFHPVGTHVLHDGGTDVAGYGGKVLHAVVLVPDAEAHHLVGGHSRPDGEVVVASVVATMEHGFPYFDQGTLVVMAEDNIAAIADNHVGTLSEITLQQVFHFILETEWLIESTAAQEKYAACLHIDTEGVETFEGIVHVDFHASTTHFAFNYCPLPVKKRLCRFNRQVQPARNAESSPCPLRVLSVAAPSVLWLFYGCSMVVLWFKSIEQP